MALLYKTINMHFSQVVIAFITTAVFALQLVALDRLHADTWEPIAKDLQLLLRSSRLNRQVLSHAIGGTSVGTMTTVPP